MEIKQLLPKDYEKAAQFAIEGMHFHWYASGLSLKLYAKYFLYLELLRATKILAAYEGDELLGVLIASVDGEEKLVKSAWKSVFVKAFEICENFLTNGAEDGYDKANREMLSKFLEKNKASGEICFFAVNPKIKNKGTGSALLAELERLEKGKKLYLFTDSGCTFQFYEKRGFLLSGKKEIEIDIFEKHIALECMLFSKEF